MEKHVGILLDGVFVGSGSGINTYVMHLCRTLKDGGYIPTVIMDTEPAEKIAANAYKKAGIEVIQGEASYRLPRFTCIESEVEISDTFELCLQPYINTKKPIALIAHSHASALCLSKLTWYKGKKCLATHIGDVMTPGEPELWDFDKGVIGEFIKLLDNDDIDLLCQHEGIVDKHLEVLPNRTTASTFVCHEPLHASAMQIQLRKEKEGAIVVAGNYDRKKLHDVIDVCAEADIPLTIITNSKSGPKEDLDVYCVRKGLRHKIILNIANQFIESQLRSHRLMIHLSDIEVCPYSVLEALPHMHAIVKANVPWTHKFFPEYTTQVELTDIGKIKEAYENYDKYPLLDLDEYKQKVLDSWVSYLES